MLNRKMLDALVFLIAVVPFSLGAGCSTLQKAATQNSTGNASRSIASVSARVGLTCISEAKAFSLREPFEVQPLETWLDQQVEEGFLSRSVADLFNDLPPEKRVEPLALALAEAYTYGQTLGAEYDRLVEKGFGIRRMMKETTTYARLQALFFLKHELIDIAFQEFGKSLIDNLEDEAKNRQGRIPVGEAQNLVARQRDAFMGIVRDFITQRAPDSRYATLALAEIERDLLDAVASVGNSCGKNTSVFPATQLELNRDVIQAAKTLRKQPRAYRLFQPKRKEAGINVESIVNQRAEKIKETWTDEPGRQPQSTSAGKVIYPDEDPRFKGPGNIYGNTFPKGTWALTFDDGPVSPLTDKVLSNLEKHDVKATFFILSQQITQRNCQGIGPRIMKDRPQNIYPKAARAALAKGHAVESHSYYHSQSAKASPEEMNCEVNTAAAEFTKVLGAGPKYFRLPYGQGVSVRSVRKWIADAGMVHVYWTVDTLDWNDKDPDSIFKRTLSQMKVGQGIILFHDVHPQSVIASEMVMAYLKDPKNALRAVTIPEIVDELNAAAEKPGR